MLCPKCRHEQPDAHATCEACGLIFARYRARDVDAAGTGRPVAPAPEPEPGPSTRAGLERPAARALAVGGGLALLVSLFSCTRFVFAYLSILVHELGHTIAAWVFGYPAIPAFDFVYGGGLTIHQGRELPLVVGVYVALAAAAYFVRQRPRLLMAAGMVTACYSVLAWTPLHEAVQIAAGHAAELVFAAIFLYRALSGAACRVGAERPAYAFAGFFLVFHALGFAVELATSPVARAEYVAAKGGLGMDFTRLAAEFLHVPLETVAAGFAATCLLPPFAAFLFHRYQQPVAAAAWRWLGADPA
jgi:hypothetical protein